MDQASLALASSASGSTRSGRTILRVSGAADSFHRVSRSPIPMSRSPSRSSRRKNDADRSIDSFSSSIRGNPHAHAHAHAPNPQNIDRTVGGFGLPQITIAGRGCHMPPEVLGQAEDTTVGAQQQQQQQQQRHLTSNQSSDTNAKKSATLANLNKAVRRRSLLAVKAIKSPAATKAAKAAARGLAASAAAAAAAPSGTGNNEAEENNDPALNSSMFATIFYGGMEVIFSYVASRQAVVGVCSRTNFLFQRLDLASETSVVSMTSNSSTGMLVVTHEDGILQTYMPVETDSDPVAVAVDGPQMQTQMQTQTQQRPKSVFGRYRWIDSVTIDAAKVFYYQSGGERIKFCDRRQRKPGDIVDVSVSYDGTLLVAHRQQLAVFKTLLPSLETEREGGTASNDDSNDAQTVVSEKTTTKAKTKDAPLLWTTVVPSPVVTAKISGDGRALVVVIDQPDKNGTFGAMTFLHDKDDGSSDPTGNGSAASMGMVFKPGPFLKHAKPISRISFRGLGHVTPSANPEENQGNDLLLTYCKGDSATRIFNQNSWRQLMLWTAPPNSRADWIRGSSAFSLGDLESYKKPANSRGARTGKSNPNSISSDLSYATGPISSGLPPIGGFRSGGAGSPTSDAGAWIAEVTFRGAYPALRLSRLSYMKRGNDGSQPAHFESIAAMLPAGSIIAESVLDADDMGLSIQGVWPAWNPWLSEPSSNNEADDSLSGSAMAFLGLSSVHPPGTNQGTFGEYYAGGTHSPPTELRLVSSHPENGHLVTMDFPLWGEDDFGAMELGSPIRSVLALSAVPSLRTEQREMPLIAASMDYESSRLCAETESEGRSISLFWRKEGCMSTYSTQWRDEDAVFARQCTDAVAPASPDLLHDVSLVPVPLALPPLKLPKGTASSNEDNVVAIRWWPDDSFGGPPLLVAVTSSKTILVYEIPPPMFALEPAMPNFDSTNPQSSISTGAASVYDNTIAEDGSDDEDSKGMQEYEVLVTPHPDFGLGLRLESPMDGLPAIAGSFKKNPLNDGILPAEKTGMINLGDELLSVNGVNLENKTFDDIIATVRHVGAELGPGKPLNMKFRPVPFDRSRKNSAVVHESFSVRSNDHSYCSAGNGKNSNGNTRDSNFDDTGSLAALLFNRSETQQEFGRVIGVLRKGVSSADGEDFEDRFVLLPWSSKAATYSSRKVRAAALMIQGCGSKLEVMRVELPSRAGLDKVQKFDLGLIDIEENNTNNANGEPVSIRSITCAESSAERWSFIVSDSLGNLRLVYLRFTEKTSYTGEGSSFEMSHKHHRIVDTGADFRDFRVLASSSNTVAWTQKSESPRRTIRVWHSRPDASSRDLQRDGAIKDEHFNKDYYESTIVVDPSESESELRDVCFLTTGYLEAFPTIAAFLTTEAIIYQRRGCNKEWTPIVRLYYPAILTSNLQIDFSNSSGKLSENVPMDAYPHLLRLIRATLHSYDEKNYILSDWHPETLFTHMCTAEKGPKSALKGDIKRILLWISDKINGSPDDNLSSSVPLLVAPLASWGGEVLTGVNDTEDEESTNVESGARLLASMQIGTSRVSTDLDKDEQQLKQLYDVLKTYVSDLSKRNGTSGKNTRSPTVSNESSQETDSIPGFLTTMNESELLVLRAILKVVIDPPKYGVLDLQGQLTLTIHSLHREIQNEADTKGQREKRTSNFSMGGVYVKRQLSSETSKSKLPPQNASAGCLAALLSDYQGLMINTIRKPGQKLSWSEARNLRLPFWLRSDEKLRQLSEEIGQQMYRESKDILKASMFFIIAGKKRTLANLAAADPTNSGRKLQKFLTDHDFSSQRGRLAAEKNAFSLLRKNQYDAASAFFLLAEPPILKSAVETIATKMEDLDLAFLVARLMGNSQPSLALGMGRGFAGIMGGGGGFAGSITTKSEATKDKEKFEDWKHKLGGVAKSLILDRILPSVHDDTCLSAVQHLWLGHSDEASNWLTGLIDGDGENAPRFATDISVPQLHNLMDSARKNRYSTILTVNSFINLASGPFLLKMMKANKRTRLASTFALSRSLVNAGIEIPAIRSLLKDMKEADFQEDQELHLTAAPKQHRQTNQYKSSIFDAYDVPSVGKPKSSVTAPSSGAMASSIFASFDAPPPPKPKVSAPASGAMSSSIFDSFDGPPKPKVSAPAPVAMSSSIFDSFDGPPKPKVSAPASGAMSSSIFDSFDGPPKPKVSAPASGAMSSSIFDSFDGPPKPKVSAPASGAMSSSIFDSFDGPPKPKVSAPASGAMSSSIFDSFDGPPKPKVSAPASGAMASSIFDSFDGPPKSKVSAPASGAMASSIFDSFDGPPKSKVSAPASGAMPSSIFDAYDSHPHTKGAPTPADSKHEEKIPYSSDSSFCETGELRSPPSIWIQWRESLIMDAAARRLVRELSTLCAPYFCDKFEGPGFCEHPLMTSESSQILQFHCDGEELMKEVCDVVEHVSKVSQLESTAIVERAIQLLHSPYQFYRTLHVILLLLAIRQVELAEDVLRTASKSLIDMCYSNALSNDHVTKGRHCAAHFSSLSSQKFAAHISWQLELCLWIHRGGALPLSGIALKEAICSVRIGYFVASRNREYETQEMLIRHPPDCLVNEKAGRQLWSSLKIISGGGRRENKVIGTGSGGWEFLVDCRRSRATELLREKPTGSFIIRPHPQDHGVFTISFKTNLIPSEESNGTNTTNSGTPGVGNASRPESRPIKRDDVVQHAIIRLSDSGFRCGSFGPFGTLMDLLEAVSSSLPFDLRFDLPPIEGIIKEEGSKPSPNSAFLRKLGMQKASYFSKKPDDVFSVCDSTEESDDPEESKQNSTIEDKQKTEMFGLFFELLLLHELRKQLSAVAVAEYDSAEWIDDTLDDIDSIGSISDASVEIGVEEEYATASRIMRPLLTWCRILEIEVGSLFAPSSHRTQLPKTSDESVKEETDSEILTSAKSNKADTGDFILRRMMKPDSGVEFQTLRLGDGGENAMVMLFCKKEAVAWILNTGIEMNEEDALNKLNLMEETRVIERVDLGLLAPKAYKKSNKADENENAATGTCSVSSDVRYRLVDPWEVEPLENREAETKGASLGRECLLAFNLPRVASCCEGQLQSIGGLPLLELWTALKGNLSLTKSLATVHPPWERSAGGDLLLRDGINTEPSIYENSIRVHLYRNSLFETMKVPQRFVALIQVELLDLKNLTSPGGSLSLTVYSLLRLKRARSSSPLTSKARTLDSVSTDPVKLAKTSGPNAPASWGSLVRFRFPLPENTDIEGKCNDRDCESLFKGPPSVLQVSVYEKKFMSDSYLGGADIKLDGLSSGGQLEEWVPLKTETQGINWFARIRLTLRFELMCLAPKNESTITLDKLAPSVGRMRIRQLCSVGGAQFDLKQSVSTPDILSYFESYFETD